MECVYLLYRGELYYIDEFELYCVLIGWGSISNSPVDLPCHVSSFWTQSMVDDLNVCGIDMTGIYSHPDLLTLKVLGTTI